MRSRISSVRGDGAVAEQVEDADATLATASDLVESLPAGTVVTIETPDGTVKTLDVLAPAIAGGWKIMEIVELADPHPKWRLRESREATTRLLPRARKLRFKPKGGSRRDDTSR